MHRCAGRRNVDSGQHAAYLALMTFIIGSGGHARVIADILHARGEPSPTLVHQSDLPERYNRDAGDVVIVGIGDNYTRRTIVESVSRDIPGCVFGNAIHPSAVIARAVEIGVGTVVMAGVVVNVGSRIGAHAI